MKGILAGKVALVTGGARGIGAAVAERFRKEGAVVEVTSRKGPFRVDVSREADCRRAVATVARRHGRLDILVNNASHSVEGSWSAPLERIRKADWDRVVEVDLTGAFLLCREAATLLRASRGCVVNFSSSAAMQGDAETLLYAGAKAGVVGLTRSLAKALAPEVRVNAVAPGSIDSGWIERWRVPPEAVRAIEEATPLKRIGTPGEIAEVALYMASDRAAFVTGQTLVVDGGVYLP